MIWSNLWYGFNIFKQSKSVLNMQTMSYTNIPINTNIINTNNTQYILFNTNHTSKYNNILGCDERYNNTNNNEEIFQNYLNIKKMDLLKLLQNNENSIPVKLEMLIYYKFLFDDYPHSSIMNGGLLDDYNFEDF